jgi:hypothetical protein
MADSVLTNHTKVGYTTKAQAAPKPPDAAIVVTKVLLQSSINTKNSPTKLAVPGKSLAIVKIKRLMKSGMTRANLHSSAANEFYVDRIKIQLIKNRAGDTKPWANISITAPSMPEHLS